MLPDTGPDASQAAALHDGGGFGDGGYDRCWRGGRDGLLDGRWGWKDLRNRRVAVSGQECGPGEGATDAVYVQMLLRLEGLDGPGGRRSVDAVDGQLPSVGYQLCLEGLHCRSGGAGANLAGKGVTYTEHTFEYVITMLQQLFGYPREKGYQLALEVHTTGRVIVLTTTKEHAELKRDQIHAFGPDKGIPRCQGSMSADIEPAE